MSCCRRHLFHLWTQELLELKQDAIRLHQSRAGMAQLVQHPTEKPGAILTRVRIPGAFFSPPPPPQESTFSADSLTVSGQPLVCNRIHQHLRVRYKILKAQAAIVYHCLDSSNVPNIGSPWYNRTGWLGVKHQFTPNIGAVSKATLGKLLTDGAELMWTFPSA